MKTCPSCQRQYDDEEMKFCLDDGSLLVEEMVATTRGSDDMSTWQMPGPSVEPPSTIVSPAAPPPGLRADPRPTAASFSVETKRRPGALLWIAVAVIVGVSGIVIALIATRARQQDRTAELALANSSSNQNVAIADATPPIDSGNPAPSMQSSPTNQPAEKPTQLSKATPAPKATPKPFDMDKPVEVKEIPPPPPIATPPRGPISGGVLNGKAVRLVQPTYPPIARSAQASGQVRVQVVIDENGNVISATAVSGHPLLHAASVSAARASKFTPTTISGQAVKVSGVINYNFVLQ